MDDALAVEIFEGIAEADGDAEGPIMRESIRAFAQDLAEGAAFDPFHDDIGAAAFGVGEEFDDGGVIEVEADLLFALDPLVEEEIAFKLEVGDLDGDWCAGEEVGAAVNAGGGAGSDQAIKCVVVDAAGGSEGCVYGFHQSEDRDGAGKKS